MSPATSTHSGGHILVAVERPGKPVEEYFVQHGLAIGRAKSNTICIDHPDVDHIHARVVSGENDSFQLQGEAQALLPVVEPEPTQVSHVEITHGLVVELGGVTLRCQAGAPKLDAMDWSVSCPVCTSQMPAKTEGENVCANCSTKLVWLEADDLKLWIPQQLGEWKINHYVARGGMGIVLQGVHVTDGRQAALKLLKPEISRDEHWRKRLGQEADIAKTFVHPNLVRLEDAGHTGELHWVAFEWIEGMTLAENLQRLKKKGNMLEMHEIAHFLLPIVQALQPLHEQGMIHRDLKPANVLLDYEGGVKLSDFGLAKEADSMQDTMLTQTGAVAGTGPYMPPEQWAGLELTPQADVFALGVLWHELLVQKLPGRKLRIQQMRPDCPITWSDAIERCLADEPQERPSLTELVNLIRLINDDLSKPAGESQEAQTPPAVLEPESTEETNIGDIPQTIPQAETPCRKKSMAKPIAIAAIALGFLIVGGILLTGKSEGEETPKEKNSLPPEKTASAGTKNPDRPAGGIPAGPVGRDPGEGNPGSVPSGPDPGLGGVPAVTGGAGSKLGNSNPSPKGANNNPKSTVPNPITAQGLVAYYPLNGSTVNMVTRQADARLATGRSAASPSFRPALDRFSRHGALSLDGIDDYLEIPAAVLNEKSVSISFWLNAPAEFRATRWNPDGSKFYLRMVMSLEENIFDLSDGNIYKYDRVISTNPMPEIPSKWCHWVFVKDSATQKLVIYLNGRLLAQGTGRHPFKSPVALLFGSSRPPRRRNLDYSQGSLDDIYIYRRALNSGEVQALFKLGLKPPQSTQIAGSNTLLSGLICFLPLDGDARDSSGKNNHGTASGITYIADHLGRSRRAAFFNGGRIRIPSSPELPLRDKFTVAFTMKSEKDLGHILMKGKQLQIAWVKKSGSATSTISASRQDRPHIIESPRLPLRVWQHVITSYDSPTARIYINGVKVSEERTVNSPSSDDADASIVIGSSGGDSFNGALDNFYFYNRALTDAEALSLFQLQSK